MLSRSHVGCFVEKQIQWSPSIPPFVKLNSDGSVTRDGHAACGGILRDNEGLIDGRFIMNFEKSMTVQTA
ncbi:hypothetical protein PIB30_010862 [Stylosanthes scabra]|uniref:RNase H type-1 domain-containing protein n=1 Tax=Stylosanthes scabra TaxID=79078 RepID=A0ABU6R6K7_9FABA|nr:hypothetical protein [Stylosanthes scabra]